VFPASLTKTSLSNKNKMGCDGGVLAMQRKFMRNIGHKMEEKPSEEMSKR